MSPQYSLLCAALPVGSWWNGTLTLSYYDEEVSLATLGGRGGVGKNFARAPDGTDCWATDIRIESYARQLC